MSNKKYFHCKTFLLIIVFFFLAHPLIYSQPGDSAKSITEKIKKDSVSKDAVSKNSGLKNERESQPPIVRRVYNYNSNDTADNHLDRAGIGDIIIVEVEHLDTLLKQSKSSGQNISLYIKWKKN